MAVRFSAKKAAEKGYTKADWDAVSDNPPLTAKEIKNLRPFREVFPEMAKAMDVEIAKRGRPQLANPKKPVTIRLDQDVIDKFKATGPGWQTKMNEALRAAKV